MPLSEESALGLLETHGLVAGIEAADAMLKASDVRLLSAEQTVPAMITLQITGEVAAVRAALDAGRAAAERVGKVLSVHLIPRPDPAVWAMQVGQAARKQAPAAPGAAAASFPDDLDDRTVKELRALARDLPGFPLQGREIAHARKDELLEMLQNYRG